MNEPPNRNESVSNKLGRIAFQEHQKAKKQQMAHLFEEVWEDSKRYTEYERAVKEAKLKQNEAKLHRDLGGINATIRSVGIKTKDSSFMSVPPGFEDLIP